MAAAQRERLADMLSAALAAPPGIRDLHPRFARRLPPPLAALPSELGVHQYSLRLSGTARGARFVQAVGQAAFRTETDCSGAFALTLPLPPRGADRTFLLYSFSPDKRLRSEYLPLLVTKDPGACGPLLPFAELLAADQPRAAALPHTQRLKLFAAIDGEIDALKRAAGDSARAELRQLFERCRSDMLRALLRPHLA